MMMILIIMGPVPTRWVGGLNIGGGRKRLVIGWYRMERKHPMREM